MKPIIVPVVLPALATLLLAQTKPEVQSPTTLRVNGQRFNDAIFGTGAMSPIIGVGHSGPP